MVKRKKSEKRRAKFEARLGPGAYLPKEEREQLNAALEQAEKEAVAEKAKRVAAAKAKKAEKPKAADKPAEKK